MVARTMGNGIMMNKMGKDAKFWQMAINIRGNLFMECFMGKARAYGEKETNCQVRNMRETFWMEIVMVKVRLHGQMAMHTLGTGLITKGPGKAQ